MSIETISKKAGEIWARTFESGIERLLHRFSEMM